MAHARFDEPLVPSFAVKLNGQPLVGDLALWIVNVAVEDDLDMPSMFTIDLMSKVNAEDGTTSLIDDERLALGMGVEISMGYGDDRESLIVGEITALEPTFRVDGPPTLTLRGYDKRHRLNAARRTRSFVDLTDSNIAEQICSDAKVSIESTDSGVTHPYVLQANQTDLEFLRERAQRIQYELAMSGDTILFRPVANDASSIVTLTLNDDLLEFRPRMSLVPITEYKVLGWDAKEKQPITASAAAGDEVGTMGGEQSAAQEAATLVGAAIETLSRTPVFSQAEADQIAAGRFNAAALDFIRGEGRARGRTDVRAGRVISLDDLGERFSGDYYVTSAVHRYTRRHGYLTDFCARRNAS
jgi:Bacteriophage probable baseplate hub protein